MSDQDEAAADKSLEKKLKQAKRNSIINSSRSLTNQRISVQEVSNTNDAPASANMNKKPPQQLQSSGLRASLLGLDATRIVSPTPQLNMTDIDFQKEEQKLTLSKEKVQINVEKVPQSSNHRKNTGKDLSPMNQNRQLLETNNVAAFKHLKTMTPMRDKQPENSQRKSGPEERYSSAASRSSNQRKESDKGSANKGSLINQRVENNFFIGNAPTDINEIVKGLISQTQEQLQKQSITENLLNRQQSLAQERQPKSGQPLILQIRQKTLKKIAVESGGESGSNQSLVQRKSRMMNLKPLNTSNENSLNLNQIRAGGGNSSQSSLENFRLTVKKQNVDFLGRSLNSPLSASGGIHTPATKRQLLIQSNQNESSSKQQNLRKFQNAVRLLIEQQNQRKHGGGTSHFNRISHLNSMNSMSLTQREEFKEDQRNDTGQSASQRMDSLFSTNQYFLTKPENSKNQFLPVPMTPMLRRNKMSFFDVVKSLNPFKKLQNNLDTRVTDLSTEMERIRVNSIEQLRLEEARRKLRARQLWRKAKSVFRAISIWKQIQTEIQMYGTHNYEFRDQFNVTKRKTVLTRSTSIRQDILDHRGGKSFVPYIHPDSQFKRLWSMLVIFFMIYVSTVMPYRLAFLEFIPWDAWYVIDILADICFFFDVFINSFSAFYDEDGTLITKNCAIFIDYLKSWFILDVIACFPITLLEQNNHKIASEIVASINIFARLLRLPRLYSKGKFTRFSKIFGSFKRNKVMVAVQEFVQMNAGIWRLFKFALAGLVCIHVSACLWYFTSKANDFDPDTWVVRNDIIDTNESRKYLVSIYWSISTVLTVGYGDVHALTNFERLISVLWMMIGVIFYSVVIGLITVILGKLDSKSSILKSKLEIIDQFCIESQVSHELKRKIKDALEYHSNRSAFSYIDNTQILNDLPVHLKCEIALQIHSGKIGGLPFFKNKDQAFIGDVVPLLQPLRVLANEYIYNVDDHPYEIYFIVEGRVNFTMQIAAECVFKTWPQGAYFGEIEIIFQKKRVCTAKAELHCDLFTLNKKYYQTTIYNDFPEIERQLREVALEREVNINSTLEKAKLVLEAIGIKKALELPIRQKRGSINSQQTTRKRREAFKNNAIKQVAQSFDEAHRSFSVSDLSMQKSHKLGHNISSSMIVQKDEKSFTLNKSSRDAESNIIEKSQEAKNKEKEKQEHQGESSSSGDFNIWGGEEKSESDDKESQHDDSLKRKRRERNKSVNSSIKSPTKTNNLDRYKEIFEQQKQKQKQMRLKKINTIKSEMEISSTDKESSDSSSSGSGSSNSSQSHISKVQQEILNQRFGRTVTNLKLAKTHTQINGSKPNQMKVKEERKNMQRRSQTKTSLIKREKSSSRNSSSTSSEDSLQTSKSLQSNENQADKQDQQSASPPSKDQQQNAGEDSVPKIKIIETIEQQQLQQEQRTSEPVQENYLSPFHTNNIDKIGHGSNSSNFLTNEELVSFQKQLSLKRLDPQALGQRGPQNLAIDKQSSIEQKFQLRVEKVLEENESSPEREVSQEKKVRSPFNYDSISSSENLSSQRKVLRQQKKKSTQSLSSFNSKDRNFKQRAQSLIKKDTKGYAKLADLILSPITQVESQKRYLEDNKALDVDSQVFQILIPHRPVNSSICKCGNTVNANSMQNSQAHQTPLASQSQIQKRDSLLNHPRDFHQQKQLKEMAYQVKRVKGQFIENSNQYENLEFKVQTLQTSMDLMAKMLKDIGMKQLQKQFQTHREEVKKSKNERSADIQVLQSQPVEKKNESHQPPRFEKYKSKMEQYKLANADDFKSNFFESRNGKSSKVYHTRGQSGVGLLAGSISSSTDWMKNSFTLDSHDSLVPIQREVNDKKKLMSTTVDDRKKEQQMIFSYSDDLEILQRDYGDPQPKFLNSSSNQSLPDQ